MSYGSSDLDEEKERTLYGGSMSTVMPKRWMDWSEHRPVPDHQEMYVDLESGQCLVIELTEMQESSPEESLHTYYRDALELNDAQDSLLKRSEALSVPKGIEQASHVGMLQARYIARGSKNNDDDEDQLVLYHLILIRIPDGTTDLFLGLHTPFRDEDVSKERKEQGTSSMLRIETNSIVRIERYASELLLRCLYHWNIHDMNLFDVPSG